MCWTWIVMSGGTLSSANSVFASLVFLWLFSSNWFPMLFYASCLTFTIFSQAVLSDKKSFQQERLCIMRLLFTKAASGWHEPNPPPALSAQPYCNTIWNSCLSWIWCFFVCWGLLLVLYFSSHHLGHLSSLDEFSGQYDPSFSLLPVNTELKYYFILFFSQVNCIPFVSVHSSRDFQYNPSFSFLPVSTELKYNLNLVTCVSFLWALSVFSINPLYCIDIGSFYIQLFQLRLWDSHRVRHGVCSLF